MVVENHTTNVVEDNLGGVSMKKLLAVGALLLVTACSSVKVAEKHDLNDEDMKNWDTTISKVIVEESLIPDWYGNQNPVYFLQKTGKMSEKDFDFFQAISKKEELTDEDRDKFKSLLNGYVGKLDRSFYLSDTNIKNPKGLVDKMVNDARLRMANPSNHIQNTVATPEEWEEIVAFSQKDDLDKKDVKRLRKILNKFIKRYEFFNENSWYGSEVSDRMMEVVNIYKRETLTKQERNNVNAKALYIAYPQYLSELEKWDN